MKSALPRIELPCPAGNYHVGQIYTAKPELVVLATTVIGAAVIDAAVIDAAVIDAAVIDAKYGHWAHFFRSSLNW
ncbi:MAG: hypothetical protein ACFHVJ_02715 [Aestuariibacter sp.]